jgi:hypothetical protein
MSNSGPFEFFTLTRFDTLDLRGRHRNREPRQCAVAADEIRSKERVMQPKKMLLTSALAGIFAIGIAAQAQADGGLPPQAGCPAQFNHDFEDLFGQTTFGPTISAIAQSGPAFGQALKPQATAPRDECPIDLTPSGL